MIDSDEWGGKAGVRAGEDVVMGGGRVRKRWASAERRLVNEVLRAWSGGGRVVVFV